VATGKTSFPEPLHNLGQKNSQGNYPGASNSGLELCQPFGFDLLPSQWADCFAKPLPTTQEQMHQNSLPNPPPYVPQGITSQVAYSIQDLIQNPQNEPFLDPS